jgi:protease I
MNLKSIKVAVLISPEFEELEFWVPVMRLQEEGASVVVVGARANEVIAGKHGITARTDLAFDSLDPANFDAVLIPGGWAPDRLRRYDSVKHFVKALDDSGKVVAMICHAGLVGISAGIVKGHTATGSEGIKDDLINAGAQWKDEPAFRSGNQVWGRVVADIPFFCRELVQALTERAHP